MPDPCSLAFCRVQIPEQHHMHERNQQFLAPSLRNLKRKAAEQVTRYTPKFRDHTSQSVAGEFYIGIEKQQPLVVRRDASCQQAYCLPFQPSGNFSDFKSRTRVSVEASCSTISAVRSVDASSITKTSNESNLFARICLTVDAMPASSFRAGIKIEIAGELSFDLES